ncbi:MAG: hypothetical protein AAGM67_06945, partial [Bacteroidota bacterium]
NFWRLYEDAYLLGVRNFVIPGNNEPLMKEIRGMLKDPENRFMAPGAKKPSHHIDDYIMGRSVYRAKDHRQAVMNLAEVYLEHGKQSDG